MVYQVTPFEESVAAFSRWKSPPSVTDFEGGDTKWPNHYIYSMAAGLKPETHILLATYNNILI